MFGGFDIWASSHPLPLIRRHDSFPGPQSFPSAAAQPALSLGVQQTVCSPHQR